MTAILLPSTQQNHFSNNNQVDDDEDVFSGGLSAELVRAADVASSVPAYPPMANQSAAVVEDDDSCLAPPSLQNDDADVLETSEEDRRITDEVITADTSDLDAAMDEALAEEVDAEEDVPAVAEISSAEAAVVSSLALLSAAAAQQPTVANPLLPYAGLENLGNSCYMASALQMLASVEDFVDQIGDLAPTTDSTMLQSLVEVWRSLQQGMTVRPEALKRVIDERSPLFVGYEQQDAHEFLTSLLDLIDEDLKKKDEAVEEEDGDQEAALKEEVNEAEVDSVPTETTSSSSSTATDETSHTALDESIDLEDMMDLTVTKRHSFADLGIDEIGQLIHGKKSADEEESTFPRMGTDASAAGNCKLVGGRMNTSDAVLSPYTGPQSLLLESVASLTSSREESTHRTPVESFFSTSVCVRLTCDSCKYTRTHEETFFHLSLEIGPDTCSIEESLRRFFVPERREIKCEKCFGATACQTTEITRLPKILILHLKRFLVNVSPDYSSVTYEKNQSSVAFHEQLSLDTDTGLESYRCDHANYALRSVVNHIGSSATFGHYTADARRSQTSGPADPAWMRFNDESVSEIAPRQATADSQRTAYILLYERRD